MAIKSKGGKAGIDGSFTSWVWRGSSCFRYLFIEIGRRTYTQVALKPMNTTRPFETIDKYVCGARDARPALSLTSFSFSLPAREA